MAKNSTIIIPTIDLTPFFTDDDVGKKEAMKTITEACSDHGFFQIVNHGVPVSTMNRALEVSKTFFDYPNAEKLKYSPESGAPLPAGYNMQPANSVDKNEYFIMFPPGSTFNIYPQNPPDLKQVMEEVFNHLKKTGLLLESIVTECLGLPQDFLKRYNDDRSWDFMVALHYFSCTDSENVGITEHEDGNCITFVFQDEVGGLEVLKDGDWIPVVPHQGNIVVNIGDVIQVLSNKKFKSATHRVVRPKDKSRYSFAFFHNLLGEKWVEPLPEFTEEIGEAPKYRGFQFKEYQELRMRNKTHPPTRPQDVLHITHYEI